MGQGTPGEGPSAHSPCCASVVPAGCTKHPPSAQVGTQLPGGTQGAVTRDGSCWAEPALRRERKELCQHKAQC